MPLLGPPIEREPQGVIGLDFFLFERSDNILLNMVFLHAAFIGLIILTATVSLLDNVCERLCCCCLVLKKPLDFIRKRITYNLLLRCLIEAYMPKLLKLNIGTIGVNYTFDIRAGYSMRTGQEFASGKRTRVTVLFQS